MSKRTLRIAGIVNDSIVDGPGMRLAIFCQGCHRHCPNCHNEHTLDPNGGFDITIDEIIEKAKNNPLLSGITLTGGEPTEQADALIELIEGIDSLHLEIAIYSGATWEELTKDIHSSIYKLITMCNVLIDGMYVDNLKSLELKFKGSSNQRAIDIKKSLESNTIVLMNDGRWN